MPKPLLPPSDFKPEYFLYHKYGPTLRATFSDAHTARMWAEGNKRDRHADMFYVENERGERVTFEVNRYGHARAVLDILDES